MKNSVKLVMIPVKCLLQGVAHRKDLLDDSYCYYYRFASAVSSAGNILFCITWLMLLAFLNSVQTLPLLGNLAMSSFSSHHLFDLGALLELY